MFGELNPRVETLLWAAGTVLFIAVGSYLVARVAAWIAGRAKLSVREQQKVFWGFLFASPWIIGFVIFVVGPSLASLYYSFTDYKLGETPEWTGIDNFRELILGLGRDGRNFRAAMYNSLFYAVVGVPLQVTTALIMALLLNTAIKGVKLFRLIFYLPVILAGGPAILLAWRYMLASNGGFVNETMDAIGNAFPPFDYLYRGFILAVEAFNGFFIGLTRGDSTGPFNFFLPALIGAILMLTLLRGIWDIGKHGTAQRAAEFILGGIGSIVLLVGLVTEPFDVMWFFVLALAVIVAIWMNARIGQWTHVRAWQVISLGIIAIVAITAIFSAPEADIEDTRLGVLLALAGCAVAIGTTAIPEQVLGARGKVQTQPHRQPLSVGEGGSIPLVAGDVVTDNAGVVPTNAVGMGGNATDAPQGRPYTGSMGNGVGWGRTKGLMIGVAAALMVGFIAVRTIPVAFGQGKADVLVDYLTLQSAIEQPDSLDYLDAFTVRYMDSAWLFGVVALVAIASIALSRRRPLQRAVISVAAIFFLVIAVSSFIDGVRYFSAYETASALEGSANFHFARYREATAVFPATDHRPKWLNSDLWVKPSLILINMWSAGAGMLIFLAALKGVPSSLYEAAKVDGATTIQRFFKITLPLISPALFYNIVIGVIAALQTFETVYILRSPDTETSVMSASYYLYQRTFEQVNIGEGSAMSWVLAAVIVGLTIAQFRYSKWVNYEV